MSLRALLWVMENAPVNSQGELCVLYALAERANDEGKCAWPSQAWIAERARCTDRTVRNHLRSLEERGVIKRGDPQFVAHIRQDLRPTVWDLNMGLSRPENQRPENSSGRKITTERPENYDRTTGKLRHNDRKTTTERPETGFRQSVHEPSVNRPEPSKKRRLPENWRPSPKAWEAAKANFPHLDLESILRDFTFYWQSKKGAKAMKVDWDRAWGNWLRNEQKWNGDSGKPASRVEQAAQMNQWIEEFVNREEEDTHDSCPF